MPHTSPFVKDNEWYSVALVLKSCVDKVHKMYLNTHQKLSKVSYKIIGTCWCNGNTAYFEKQGRFSVGISFRDVVLFSDQYLLHNNLFMLLIHHEVCEALVDGSHFHEYQHQVNKCNQYIINHISAISIYLKDEWSSKKSPKEIKLWQDKTPCQMIMTRCFITENHGGLKTWRNSLKR